MTGVRHWIWPALAVMIAGSGCTDPNSPWYVKGPRPAKKPVAAATPTNALSTRSETGPDTPSSRSDAGATDAADATRRVQEFLDRLAEIGPDATRESDPESTAAPSWPRPDNENAAGVSPPTGESPGPVVANAAMALAAAGDSAEASPSTPTPPPPEKPRIESVVIRSPAGDDEPPTEEPKRFDTNAPLATHTEDEEQTLASIIARLKTHVAETPNDLDAQWKLSLLQLAAGQDAQAAQVSEEITQETAELIADTIRAVAGVRRAVLDPGPATDEAFARVEALRHRLVEEAELLIPKVALCTRVSTFGVYDEMPMESFVPHQANRTIVYCELKNFYSEPTNDERFRVTLSSRLELLTADGDLLWEHVEPNIEDRSKQRREDFFLAQLVTLPPVLGPGEYVLKVTIEDVTAAKACQAICPLRVETPSLTSATR